MVDNFSFLTACTMSARGLFISFKAVHRLKNSKLLKIVYNLSIDNLNQFKKITDQNPEFL